MWLQKYSSIIKRRGLLLNFARLLVIVGLDTQVFVVVFDQTTQRYYLVPGMITFNLITAATTNSH